MAVHPNKGQKKKGGRLLLLLRVALALLVLAAVPLFLFLPPAEKPAKAPVTEKKPEREEAKAALPSESQSPVPIPPALLVPPEEPESPPPEPAVTPQSLLSRMSLEEKVYQLFLVTPEKLLGVKGPVTQVGPEANSALRRSPVGGVIFFAGNLETPQQTTKLIADLKAASPLGLFIAVDEEGGAVARLGKNPAMGTTSFRPMGEIGDTGDGENARRVGQTIGSEIQRFGFNLDFAPVADVNSNPNNPVLGNRAFSSDPQIAAGMVAFCVAGFRESGTLCTLKHFPGHGDTETDSHYGAASNQKTLQELRAEEFLPFQAGIAAGAELVMTGHISLPNVTGNDTPASLSYEITTTLLRGELGFTGLIVTDSMSMKAITNYFSSGEAAVKAFQAGADLILMPANLEEAAGGIIQAVRTGAIPESRLEESVSRILSLKMEKGILPPA